jgi:hypothetical protein
MSGEKMTISAAIYFASEPRASIPMHWLDSASEFFAEHSLSPVLFSTEDGGHLSGDCYVLAEHGGNIIDDDGYVLAARGTELVEALRDGAITGLYLDSPRSISAGRSDWRAAASVSLIYGLFYVGLDDALISNPAELLRRAYGIAEGTFNVRYGIAYSLPLAGDPACFAIGHPKQSPMEVLEMIRHRPEWGHRKRTPDELWRDELIGEKRHLTGLFRGAYPANILSDTHLRRVDPSSLGVGAISPLGAGLWLWEIDESEIPEAQDALDKAGVLIK